MRPFTPGNIVEFEFARTTESAIRILTLWSTEGKSMARLSLTLDFVFLVLYSWTISLGCLLAADFSKAVILKSMGNKLSKIAWIAGLCDLTENVCLLLVIHQMNRPLLEISFWMAAIKFTGVAIALLFIILATGTGLVKSQLKK